MLDLSIQEILVATGAKPVFVPEQPKACTVLIHDSREVTPGSIFVAFKGEHSDGNLWANKAIEQGASVIVLSAEATPDVIALAQAHSCTLLQCKNNDPEEFMLLVAHAWRAKNPQWNVVGITGSVGKTTVKEMCTRALSVRYKVHATQGNFNSLIGLPIVVSHANPEDEVLVLEMGMNHENEIKRLSKCVLPNVSVITNIGTAHIGLLGSQEAICHEKAQILAGQTTHPANSESIQSALCLFSGDSYTSTIADSYAQPHGVPVVTCGFSPSDFVKLKDVTYTDAGCAQGLVYIQDKACSFTLSIPGYGAVVDFALALAVAHQFGVDARDAVRAIETLAAPSMRSEIVQTSASPKIINDTYNASPASIACALDTLDTMECAGKKVVVLGEMGELGNQSGQLHELVGAYASAKQIDLLCAIGSKDAQRLVRGAQVMGMSAERLAYFSTQEEALKVLCPGFTHNDIVLVKGSRSAKLDVFVNEVLQTC